VCGGGGVSCVSKHTVNSQDNVHVWVEEECEGCVDRWRRGGLHFCKAVAHAVLIDLCQHTHPYSPPPPPPTHPLPSGLLLLMLCVT